MTTRKVPHLIVNYTSTTIFIFSIFLVCASLSASGYIVYRPAVFDPSLKLGIVYRGNFTPIIHELNQLSPVTQFSFLGSNDILLLSKLDGKVLRVQNHTLLPESLLDVNVTNQWESGLLGIAISKNAGKVYVFLYYTQSKTGDGSDVCPTIFCTKSTDSIQNKLYRFELKNNKLINPKLLFSAPNSNVASHIGGALEIGPDNYLYLIIGDIHGYQNKTTTLAQNYKNGLFPDGRAGILRLTQDGKAVGGGLLGKKYPLNLYYAYGIRNSFGIDWDPVTGYLWDSENGPNFGDELNLVQPGFNSGWASVQGYWKPELEKMGPLNLRPNDLVSFGGHGTYSAPEFTWLNPVAPSAIKFLDTSNYGSEYKNDLLVGDANNGNIYDFDLDGQRKNFELSGRLSDKIANNNGELNDLVFANGFGKVTDMEIGPDGLLYVLSTQEHLANIYRISPH